MSKPGELIPKMWEVLNSLSDDARKAAIKKCKELELDPDKGEVPLGESLINLDAGAQTLRDAIEKKKLIQLPLTVQRELIAKLEAVAEFLAGLNSGSDQIINLVNAIEQLNTAIWQYGLHNLSEEVLGYQTKMNQLKSEETVLKSLRDDLEGGLKLKEELQSLLSETKAAKESIASASTDATKTASEATQTLEEITALSQTAAARAAATEQNETSSTQQASTAKASAAEVQAIANKIMEFFAEIGEYREKITSVSDEAKANVDANRKETSDLVSRLSELEDQIKDRIEKATGFSLFLSFQTRQGKIAFGRRFWASMLAAVVILSLILTGYIAHSTELFNIGFYLKLSMSIPLIYALSFCTIQYSRERRLEEEYAFKSAISVSLEAYQSLVSRLIDKGQPEELQKFTAFILGAIEKIYTSPTAKIFEPKENTKGLSEKTVKRVAEIVGNFARAAKP